MQGLSQTELPAAPTQEHAEELQVRTLLSNNVIPKGNQMVLWMSRDSLTDNIEGQDGLNKYGKGLQLSFNHPYCLLMITTRVPSQVVRSLCTPGPLEGGSTTPLGGDKAGPLFLEVEVE